MVIAAAASEPESAAFRAWGAIGTVYPVHFRGAIARVTRNWSVTRIINGGRIERNKVTYGGGGIYNRGTVNRGGHHLAWNTPMTDLMIPLS